jgi:YVTN family beta-propeller protein
MRHLFFILFTLSLVCIGCSNSGGDEFVSASPRPFTPFPSQSGPVQIHPNDQVVFTANFEGDSVTAVRVRFGSLDDATVLGEVPVGDEPRSLSIHPSGTFAYVSNSAGSTVSVIRLGSGGFGPYSLVAEIPVGSEPRGTALTPSGSRLYVANYSDGTVSVIDTSSLATVGTISLGANSHPYAIAVTNDGDGSDSDEKVYISEFFAAPRPGLARDAVECFDDGKEGRVHVMSVETSALLSTIALAPKASGFTANQTAFCTANGGSKDTFCGSATEPSFCFPNQLYSIAIDPDTGRAYVTTIAASPEPPVNFSNNVQSLVSVFDTVSDAEVASEAVNLNNQIRLETDGAGLDRAFAADIVAMFVREGRAVIVSRAGSYALSATFDSAGVLTLNAPATVRYVTGNIPTGVTMNSTGTRAYIYAEVDSTLTSVNTELGSVLSEVPTAELPFVGSDEHNILLGKLVFFTSLGVPPDLVGRDVRAVDTVPFRGLASNNGWSSCGSCHPDGLADGVTWSFITGPRQTLPLDASFSPINAADQRVFNWNAVQGSVTDFNNNARGVQGGVGFTFLGNVDAGLIYNHGPNSNVSEALDLMTLWVQAGIRIFNRPSNLDFGAVGRGRVVFAGNCASCHGGPKWSSSQIAWPYPLFDASPLTTGVNLYPGLVNTNGAVVLSSVDPDTLVTTPIIQNVGTLDLTNPIEVRGTGTTAGQNSAGAAVSFNPPSLINATNTAPYGHHGRARTLFEVFETIANGGLGHPNFGLSPTDLADVAEFVRSIDGNEPPF